MGRYSNNPMTDARLCRQHDNWATRIPDSWNNYEEDDEDVDEEEEEDNA